MGLHVGLLIFARPGFLGSDDIYYTQIVRQILDGRFHVHPRQFYNRFGLLFPVALAVRWLGMNPWSSILWPLLCSCATVLLVFCWTARRYGRTAAIFAGILMATSASQIHWAMHVMPDVVLGTMLFGAVLCLESCRTATGPGLRWGWAAAFGVAVFCAICTKMTAIWIAPFLALSLGIDLARGKAWKPWVSIAVAGAASAGAYMVMYWVLTGDPLFRIHSVEAVFTTGSLPDTFEYSRSAYLERLIHQPLRLVWTDRSFRALCILTLCMLVGLRPHERQDQSGGVRLGLYALTFCSTFWFGSISLTRYRPIEPLGRYLLPMIPPMAVCSGILMATVTAKPDTHPGVLRPLRKLFRIRYLALTLMTLSVLFHATLNSHHVIHGRIGELESTAIDRRFVANHLALRDTPVVVYTDQRSIEVLRFHLSLGGKHTALIKHFSEYDPEEGTSTVKYLHVNQNALAILRNLYKITHDEEIAKLLKTGSWKLVTSTPDVEIYQRTD
jgi:4-amino-4-deoxy-L-arabinose transferase-like glycosyltransferase